VHPRGAPLLSHSPGVLVKTELSGTSGGHGPPPGMEGGLDTPCPAKQLSVSRGFSFPRVGTGGKSLPPSYEAESEAIAKRPAGSEGTDPAVGCEGAGASGAASSRHCHMSPASPFSWNLWTWSAYLRKGHSHVSHSTRLEALRQPSGSRCISECEPR